LHHRAVLAAVGLVALRVVAEGQVAIDPQFVALVMRDDIADLRAAEAVADRVVGVGVVGCSLP